MATHSKANKNNNKKQIKNNKLSWQKSYMILYVNRKSICKQPRHTRLIICLVCLHTRAMQKVPGPTHFWWMCAYQLNMNVIRHLSQDFWKKKKKKSSEIWLKFFLYCPSNTRIVDVLKVYQNSIVLLHFDISFLIYNMICMSCFCCKRKFDHLLMVWLQNKLFLTCISTTDYAPLNYAPWNLMAPCSSKIDILLSKKGLINWYMA